MTYLNFDGSSHEARASIVRIVGLEAYGSVFSLDGHLLATSHLAQTIGGVARWATCQRCSLKSIS